MAQVPNIKLKSTIRRIKIKRPAFNSIAMYPLKFKPFLKFYPYGGRRFVEVLEMQHMPRDRDIAESWEIADHGPEQSIVINGPHGGKTLRQLMQEDARALVGSEVFDRYGDYFPLLLKFLDCDKRLPAHLHPDDETTRKLGMSDPGKTEAWYIARADPGAQAYIGSAWNLTPEKFAEAIEKGDTYDAVMNFIPTETGDTFFVPAGRMHALDEGNLVFEIQQNSDAGFGWDWAGFVEAGVITPEDAQEHKTLAVQAATYENGARQNVPPVTLEADDLKRTFCCACNYFVLEKWNAFKTFTFTDEAPRFNTITVINGAALFRGNGEETFARRGESLLIPAGVDVEIVPQGLTNLGEVEFLRTYVPNLERDVVEFLRENGIEDRAIAALGSYGKGNDLQALVGIDPDTFLVTQAERDAAIKRVAQESTVD